MTTHDSQTQRLGRDAQLRLLEKLECRHCGAWVAPTRLAAERHQKRCPKLVAPYATR
jgi:hypothetical protein